MLAFKFSNERLNDFFVTRTTIEFGRNTNITAVDGYSSDYNKELCT